ncbi:hypothetical protein EcWSU1_02021 [Enterobacter ludwigii]|uniref:Uncharacterized protein n=1 Tax=Enterobacter ludwigii TaxID=299767 RepID=G8LN42_9ENTR|nr:hypothetical protein EcWSU1_02021 [Enterobacter ludwigii]
MQRHRFFYTVLIALFQRTENIMMLSEQHFRWGDVVEAHIAHAVDGGFDVFNRVPGQLTVRNLRQLLVKLVIKLEEVVELFAVNRNTLLMQVLLQQVALVVINQGCGTARHRALNGLTDKTAVTHLGERDFVHIAAALRADLNQTVFCKLDKRLTHGLAGHVKPHGHLFFRERRSGWDQAMDNITSQNAIDLLVYGLGRIELRFSGHELSFLRELA